MIRGTTPCLGVKCDMNLTQFRNVCTIWQGDLQYIIEPTAIMVDDVCYVYCVLTQEQTLSFEPNKPYFAQMRSVDENGFAVASFKYTGVVYDVRKDGVLPYEDDATGFMMLGNPLDQPTEEPSEEPEDPTEEQTEEPEEEQPEEPEEPADEEEPEPPEEPTPDPEPIEEPEEPIEEEVMQK